MFVVIRVKRESIMFYFMILSEKCTIFKQFALDMQNSPCSVYEFIIILAGVFILIKSILSFDHRSITTTSTQETFIFF